jgi:hypothetical protein
MEQAASQVKRVIEKSFSECPIGEATSLILAVAQNSVKARRLS